MVLAVRFILLIQPISARCFLVESHLQTQRAAVKMLHDRILVLVNYVKDVLSGMSCNPARHIYPYRPPISRFYTERSRYNTVSGCSCGITPGKRQPGLQRRV